MTTSSSHNSGDGSNRAQWTRAMSGDRGSSGSGRKRKRSTAGRPKKNTTPSVAQSSRESAGSAAGDNSLSGDTSSRAGPAGRTPASAVQPLSSGGSSLAGAASSNQVRRRSHWNDDLQQPPVSNGEAIRDARAEESTPSVAGVRRRNHSSPVRRSTRRRGG